MNMNNRNNNHQTEWEKEDEKDFQKYLKNYIHSVLTPKQIEDAHKMYLASKKLEKMEKFVKGKYKSVKSFISRHKSSSLFAGYVVFAMILATSAFKINEWHLESTGENMVTAAVEQTEITEAIVESVTDVIGVGTGMTPVVEIPTKYVYTTDYLNVRTSAEIDDTNKVMVLAPAKKLQIEDQLVNNDWYKAIDLEEGKEYYVNKDYIVDESNTVAIEEAKQKLEAAKKKTQTAPVNNVTVSRGGNIDYKNMLSVQATAYSGHNNTATGRKPVYNPGGLSTIAVDPRVIPLGSKVYVEGYGYAIAADTGGAIKGNIIDVYLDSSSACVKWGRKHNVTVYIIAYPGEW